MQTARLRLVCVFANTARRRLPLMRKAMRHFSAKLKLSVCSLYLSAREELSQLEVVLRKGQRRLDRGPYTGACTEALVSHLSCGFLEWKQAKAVACHIFATIYDGRFALRTRC